MAEEAAQLPPVSAEQRRLGAYIKAHWKELLGLLLAAASIVLALVLYFHKGARQAAISALPAALGGGQGGGAPGTSTAADPSTTPASDAAVAKAPQSWLNMILSAGGKVTGDTNVGTPWGVYTLSQIENGSLDQWTTPVSGWTGPSWAAAWLAGQNPPTSFASRSGVDQSPPPAATVVAAGKPTDIPPLSFPKISGRGPGPAPANAAGAR